VNLDGFVKSPDAALRFILRHCSVLDVHFIPQNLRALPANFLQIHPGLYFFDAINLVSPFPLNATIVFQGVSQVITSHRMCQC